jgi:hypothetical protein
MGKNLDTDKIFNSYINRVILNEAVKDTEVDSPPRQLTPEQQAAVQKIMNEKGYNKTRAEYMVLRGQEIQDNQTPYAKSFNANAKPVNPTSNTTQPETPQTKEQSIKITKDMSPEDIIKLFTQKYK